MAVRPRRSSRPDRFGRTLSVVLLAVGASLFAINLLGAVGHTRLAHSGAAGLRTLGNDVGDTSAVGLPAYLRQVQAGAPCDLLVATERVYLGTRHSDGRRIHWTENWLHFLLGKLYRPLAQHTECRAPGGRSRGRLFGAGRHFEGHFRNGRVSMSFCRAQRSRGA